MHRLIFGLAFLALAQAAIDPLTGYYVPPLQPGDVQYPVDDDVSPMGFQEIPPPMKQEWKDPNDAFGYATTTFKYKYVSKSGLIHPTNPGNAIEVAATGWVSETGHVKGARIVAIMLRNINPAVWDNMVRRRVRIGIFSRHEALSVYPEYRDLADTPQCKGSCSGACRVTCTFDGRKWDTVAGAGGVRAAILESNILCDQYDPYRKGNNILAHEFIHTIHMNGLPSAQNGELNEAFENAKRQRLWTMSSYAMQTVYEYFAEAGGVWFYVNHNHSSGGMDTCSGGETACRNHLKRRDPKLFQMLKYTFSPNDAYAPGNLQICV